MRLTIDDDLAITVAPGPATPRQLEVLDAIRRHMIRTGAPPSFREIGAQIGTRSPNAISGFLRGLMRRGLVARVGGPSRRASYVPVVPAGCCPTCARPL